MFKNSGSMKEEIVQSQMNHLNLNDSSDKFTTDFNTNNNKSLLPMDSNDNSDSVQKKKIRKSITLNLKAQPPTPASKSLKPNETPKGILKKPDNNAVHETGRDYFQKVQDESSIPELRPHNLDELKKTDGFIPSTIESTFSLDDLSDDDEIFLMEIPKSVNPEFLKGQVLSLRDKSKLKVGKDSYIASHRDVKGNMSCVLSDAKGSKSYKAVNIKPAGIIQVRQKLPAIPKTKLECTERTKVPLPQNIKHRDPFLGVVTNVKLEKDSR